MVLRAGRGAEEALVRLCQIYWPPLYAYIRRRGHAVHEAQDLTQAFFAHILENRALEAVGPSKGRFRSFLLASLKHFLDNEWHKAHTLKRGGQHVFISWDDLKPEDRESLELSDRMTPERIFQSSLGVDAAGASDQLSFGANAWPRGKAKRSKS
jgi:RNA polymerase sigma-70 factor (ECF subfamily)